MSSAVAEPVAFDKGDRVRLSFNSDVPSRYRGTVGEVVRQQGGGYFVNVSRRKAPLFIAAAWLIPAANQGPSTFKDR